MPSSMALNKKDKEDIAGMIAEALKPSDDPGDGSDDSDGDDSAQDVVILKGDAAKDFLDAMGGGSDDGDGDDKGKPKNRWSSFGDKYFGPGE